MIMQASHVIVFFLFVFSLIQKALCRFPLYSNNPLILAQEQEHLIELISLCVVPAFV